MIKKKIEFRLISEEGEFCKIIISIITKQSNRKWIYNWVSYYEYNFSLFYRTNIHVLDWILLSLMGYSTLIIDCLLCFFFFSFWWRRSSIWWNFDVLCSIRMWCMCMCNCSKWMNKQKKKMHNSIKYVSIISLTKSAISFTNYVTISSRPCFTQWN